MRVLTAKNVRHGAVVTSFALVVALSGAGVSSSSAAQSPEKSPEPVLLTQVGLSHVLYVLWTVNCTGSRSCYALERSDDGGETFTRTNAPAIAFARNGQPGPLYQLDFANAMDGLAVVQSKSAQASLYVTFNGGETWQRDVIAPDQRVNSVASTPSTFYAVTSTCPAGASRACPVGQLDSSPVDSMHWTPHALPIGSKFDSALPSITAYGHDVWLTTQEQAEPYKSLLATSYNNGDTFAVRSKPLLSSVVEAGLTATSSVTLWGVSDQGMMAGNIVFSHDGGATWFYGHGGVSHFGFGTFDPFSTFAAVFVNYMDGSQKQDVQLLASASSRAVALGRTPSSWVTQLAFVSPEQGLALGQSGGRYNTLYETSDGAKNWRVATLAP
jgi:photosystem II stability/assembly factor-like uncharacterized protein